MALEMGGCCSGVVIVLMGAMTNGDGWDDAGGNRQSLLPRRVPIRAAGAAPYGVHGHAFMEDSGVLKLPRLLLRA